MNTKVSYGALAPAIIGGLGVIVQALMTKAKHGESPVVLKKLSEVLKFSDSGIWGDDSLDPNIDPCVFRVSDFSGDFCLNYATAPPRSIPADKLNKFRLCPGDILVVKSSGSAKRVVSGRVAVFDNESERAYVASNFLLRLRPKSEVDPYYLSFVLGSPPVREAVAESVKTMTYPNLSFRIYGQIEIPVIPLRDQQAVSAFFKALMVNEPLPELPTYISERRRIVARIEELAAKIEEARLLRQQALTEAQQVLGMTIERLFTERKNEPWTDGYLGDYVNNACYGTSEKACDEPYGIPILRMGNIQNGIIDTKDLKYLHIAEKDRQKWILRPNDILVNRTNSAELVGKCAVFDLDGDWGFASYLIRLRLDLARAEPALVAYYINSPMGRKYMFSERKQMTGQANINAQKLKALPISLPDLSVQRQITTYLNEMKSRVNKLCILQVETAAELDALMPSILDRAFKGELC